VSGGAISGSFTVNLPTGANKDYYALDGKGRLYVSANVGGTPTLKVYDTSGAEINHEPSTTAPTNVVGLLGFADRALIRFSSATTVNEIVIRTGSGDYVVNNRGTALHTVLTNCTEVAGTKRIDGAGSNFVRCAHTSGLYSLTYDRESGLYLTANNPISSIDDVKWATNKALVKPSSGSIKLCTTTTAPSISCFDTDLPNFDTTVIGTGTGKYLKSNGDDVFYTISGGGLKVGNIFDPPSALPIAVSNASGGNASFDLRRFAFTSRPPTAPPECNTQIVYFPSPSGPEKRYTLDRANTCVSRILKVY